MSAQEGLRHPPAHSSFEASIYRIEDALGIYGSLTEERLVELLCHRANASCTRAALRAAVRSGAVRHVGDLYALTHR